MDSENGQAFLLWATCTGNEMLAALGESTDQPEAKESGQGVLRVSPL